MIKTKNHENLYSSNDIKYFDNFTFDILTSEELKLVRGGKEVDVYIDPK